MIACMLQNKVSDVGWLYNAADITSPVAVVCKTHLVLPDVVSAGLATQTTDEQQMKTVMEKSSRTYLG